MKIHADAVRALAGEIGPRPPGSGAEHRAAEWCAARLDQLGYEVDVDAFAGRTSYQSAHVVYVALSCLAAMLVGYSPPFALVIAAIALLFYARDVDGRPLIKQRGVTSRNVIARSSKESPSLIVLAHLDSAIEMPHLHPKAAGAAFFWTGLFHGALFGVLTLAAAAWVAEVSRPVPRTLAVAGTIVGVYLFVVLLVILNAAVRGKRVAGANGNASGIEVLLRIAATKPPGVWFVITGSKEAGMLGVQELMAQHADKIGEARFLNIDSVGGGTISAISEEGILRVRRADALLLRLAEAAGAEDASFRVFPTDSTALIARKYRALTLMGLSPEGVPPNCHWHSDVPANTDPSAIDRATEIATAVVSSYLSEGDD
jgi:hypothetical protein